MLSPVPLCRPLEGRGMYWSYLSITTLDLPTFYLELKTRDQQSDNLTRIWVFSLKLNKSLGRILCGMLTEEGATERGKNCVIFDWTQTGFNQTINWERIVVINQPSHPHQMRFIFCPDSRPPSLLTSKTRGKFVYWKLLSKNKTIK